MVKAGIIRKIRPAKAFTYAELATLTGKCEATIRQWEKDGMRALKTSKPHLIIGSDARDYLTKRFHPKRQKMAPGEVHCFKCKTRRQLETGLADIVPNTSKGWRLEGLCTVCEKLCSRIISESEIPLHAEKLGLEGMSGFKPNRYFYSPLKPSLRKE